MEKKGVSHIKADKISVFGFKSLVNEQSIEIKPITILAGANSSGKSSIMQPLLLLKQTIEAPYDPGALLLHGPNVRITSADQLLSKISPSKCSDRFSLSYANKDGWTIKITFRKIPRRGLDIDNMAIKHERSSDVFIVKPDMSSEEILAIPLIPDDIKALFNHKKTGERKYSVVVLRDRCLLSFQLFMGEGDKRIPLLGFPFLGNELIPPLKNQIEKIIHVPALRGNPERTYKTTSVGDNYPGTFEDYVASIIHHWKKNRNDKLDQLGHALEKLGLTWKIESKSVDDTQVELRVGRLPHAIRGGAHDLVNIADVGFGLSQILPVIVSILIAKQDHIIYIEEPEIHLHPRAQFSLPSLLLDAAKRKVKFIIETHSSLFIRGVQTLIAKGELPENLVKFHWFKRTQDGATEIFSSDLDKDGAFGDWPEDFDDVYLNSEKDYLDAVERRLVG